MVYKWKTNFYKAPASVAAQVMDELTQTGGLTAQRLVDVSRPESAPLHDDFEWNNDKAAEMFRQEQARHMIQNIVVIADETPKQEQTRAFVHIVTEENTEGSYEPIHVVLHDEDKTAILIKCAERELAAFRAKYAGIKAFARILSDIDGYFGKTNEPLLQQRPKDKYESA